jgi:hypothetical protein
MYPEKQAYPDVGPSSVKDAGASQRLLDVLAKLAMLEGGLIKLNDMVVGPRPSPVPGGTSAAPQSQPSLTLLVSRIDEAVNRCMGQTEQLTRNL